MTYIRTKEGRIVEIGEQTDIGYKKGTFEIHNKSLTKAPQSWCYVEVE